MRRSAHLLADVLVLAALTGLLALFGLWRLALAAAPLSGYAAPTRPALPSATGPQSPSPHVPTRLPVETRLPAGAQVVTLAPATGWWQGVERTATLTPTATALAPGLPIQVPPAVPTAIATSPLPPPIDQPPPAPTAAPPLPTDTWLPSAPPPTETPLPPDASPTAPQPTLPPPASPIPPPTSTVPPSATAQSPSPTWLPPTATLEPPTNPPPTSTPTAPPADDEVTICHHPPGNPANANTIVVRQSELQSHLDHGDTLGPCP
jgi:hypothetical protein